MQSMIHMIFFTMLISSHGLKLLVNDDYVEDDDEAWESDIEFSYKPLKGRCGPGDGTGGTTSDDSDYSSHGASCRTSNGLPGTGPNDKLGCLNDKTCDNAAYSAAVKDKYCLKSSWPGNADLSKKFKDIFVKVLALANGTPNWKLSKLAHYMAKLASMSNVQSSADGQKVKSFDIRTDFDRFMFYKTAHDTSTAADYWCYTKPGIAWAKNDPKVKNMDGDEFEIMATGTFSLLSLKQSSSLKTVLEASATIDRAGTRCGATYIQNLTLSGQWVEDTGFPSIEIKAEAAVPKAEALQINFAGEWQPAASKFSYAAVKKANAKKIVVQVNKIEVLVSVDSHRIHESGYKTKRFANFLNVNFQGISTLSGFSVNGLLGRDSHAEATQLPDGCESAQFTGKEKKDNMWSNIELA